MRLAMTRVFILSTMALSGACVNPDQGAQGPAGPQGEKGDRGEAGNPGVAGSDAIPCGVKDNEDGSYTITCPGNDPITVRNGSDGTDGADGQDGTDGVPGLPGATGQSGQDGQDGISCSAYDNGDGSQTIECTDGTHIYLEPAPMDPYLDLHEDLPGVVATVVDVSGASNADGTFAPGDQIALTFKVQNRFGRAIPLGQLDGGSAWLAGPTSNYQHILPTARDATSYGDVLETAVYNGDGTWTYTFPDPIPGNFGAPLFDTAKFTEGELTGPLTAGTYTVTLNFYKTFYYEGDEVLDSGHLQHHILFDHATTVTPRAVVSDQNCAKCHDKVEGHEGRYEGVDVCVTCHASGAEDRDSTDFGDPTPVTIDFKVMLHKLHNGAHLPSVLGVGTNADGSRKYDATKSPYVVGEKDFSGILFPSFPNFSIAMPKDAGYSALSSANRTLEDTIRKGVTACTACHGDPDGAGELPAPAQGNLAFTAPSRAACGSCHDDLDYSKPYTANGQTMPANLGNNTCAACHTESTGTVAIRKGHLHPVLDTELSPEVAVKILSVSGGTGASGKLQVGDRPTVSFEIKQGANNAPLTDFTSFSLALTGPTTNRQVVAPGTLASSPFHFAGRLASASTSNKGVMGKAVAAGTTTNDTLVVEFTSSTAFTVAGRATGSLGTGTLDAAASTYPSGFAFSNIVTTGTAAAQSLTLEFTSPTAFDVKAGVNTIGSALLPASTSATVRFTSLDGTIAFNVTAGTTAATAGQKAFVSIFKGNISNPVVFAIIAGRTAFAAKDRFYYDFVGPSETYTTKLPMDLPLEFLGTGNGAAGQTFTAANTPVWFGRQTLYEQTARVDTTTTLTKASTIFSRHIYVASTNGLAANDYLLFDEGTPSAEYSQVSAVDAATGHVTLKTSALRFPHASNAIVREVTFTTRVEGLDYTLDSSTGTLTLVSASTNPFVMTYRTDGRFGWKRSATDSLQALYYAPIDNAEVTDETWGDWRGKPLVDGTYTFAMWGYIPLEYGAHGEWQSYRGTTKSSRFDVLYGAATTVTPYALIESGSTCNACHTELSFHGGGREGGDTCFLCHSTPGPTVHFNTLLHEAHEAAFPVKPNGSAQCTKCHGTATVWESPSDRNHPTAEGRDVRDWSVSCTGCHSSSEAVAHTDVMTAPNGVESCKTCHGTESNLSVRLVHRVH